MNVPPAVSVGGAGMAIRTFPVHRRRPGPIHSFLAEVEPGRREEPRQLPDIPRTGSASRRARPPRLTRLAFRQVLSRKMPPPTQDPSARERRRMTALRNRDPIALTGVRFVGSRRWRSTPKRDAFLSAQSDARRFSGAEFPIGTPSPRETEYVAVDPMAS